MDRIADMLTAAKQARAKAYAPYSNYRVGAAVLSAAGKIVPGCNVENASYGLCVCAERVAVWSANTSGDEYYNSQRNYVSLS